MVGSLAGAAVVGQRVNFAATRGDLSIGGVVASSAVTDSSGARNAVILAGSVVVVDGGHTLT